MIESWAEHGALLYVPVRKAARETLDGCRRLSQQLNKVLLSFIIKGVVFLFFGHGRVSLLGTCLPSLVSVHVSCQGGEGVVTLDTSVKKGTLGR
jgi:hypothetical protein